MSNLNTIRENVVKKKLNRDGKFVVFTCNWNAYNALESAGISRLAYSTAVYPIKVLCIGQISTGVILKTLAKGAEGVLLIGCPSDECHFGFGNKRAEDIVSTANEISRVLGYQNDPCQLKFIQAGDAEGLINTLEAFINGKRV